MYCTLSTWLLVYCENHQKDSGQSSLKHLINYQFDSATEIALILDLPPQLPLAPHTDLGCERCIKGLYKACVLCFWVDHIYHGGVLYH